MSETDTEPLSVRDRVIDTEDDDPDVGVVVWKPSEMTIADSLDCALDITKAIEEGYIEKKDGELVATDRVNELLRGRRYSMG